MIGVTKKIFNKMDPNTLKYKADIAYFNSDTPIMKDEDYDALCNHFKLSATVGCSPTFGKKVDLPVFMGSLTKYNTEEKLKSFLSKYDDIEFIVEEKLDGVSCLLRVEGKRVMLYSRGNGTVGTDITHLIGCGLQLPSLSGVSALMVRGELVVSNENFAKYQNEFKNARNMVSGQLAKHSPDSVVLKDIDFVAYEIIDPNATLQQSYAEQIDKLRLLEFKVVYNRKLKQHKINESKLSAYLSRRKQKSKYQIDGLVISVNKPYTRSSSDNPKYAFAFKIQGETAETVVTEVMWALSKSGKYKPRVLVEPVKLSGVVISSLTGFNARYIVDNHIITGAKILITRRGDVIPHIVAVLETDRKIMLELPKNSTWRSGQTAESVDLYHTFSDDPQDVVIKKMVYFFTSLNSLNCKDKTMLKIYNAGFTTIERVIEATVEELQNPASPTLSTADGIGIKLAHKIASSIYTQVQNATYHELLAALNVFGEGIGLKKIQTIPIQSSVDDLQNSKFDGLSTYTMVNKIIPYWIDGLNRVKHIKSLVGITDSSLPVAQRATSQGAQMGEGLRRVSREKVLHNLNVQNDGFRGRTFVFTVFRDSSLEKRIVELGGKVTSSVSQKTTDVIFNTLDGKQSAKLLNAKKVMGCKLTSKTDFVKSLQLLTRPTTEIEYDTYSCSDEETQK